MNRYQSGKWLADAIGWDAKNYLAEDVNRLIFDWAVLEEIIDSNREEAKFYDYSFLMAPMYKAIEGALWKIATDLNLVRDRTPLGDFFDDANINSSFTVLIERISGEVDIVESEQRKKLEEIKEQLGEMKVFLRRYRHNPAHFGVVINTFEKAEVATRAALHNIGCLITDLLALSIIKLPIEAAPADISNPEEVDIEDIPF